jgi:hypothetical protein
MPSFTSNFSVVKSFFPQMGRRTFATKDDKEKPQTSDDKPAEEEKKTHQKEADEEEFKHDETINEDPEANFSTGRKLLFALGKTIKYSIWSY